MYAVLADASGRVPWGTASDWYLGDSRGLSGELMPIFNTGSADVFGGVGQ
jgi:hypothetical protein